MAEPNIKLAANAEPLGKGPVNYGMDEPIQIPDEETQREGWYLKFDHAHKLIELYEGRFKLIREKGAHGDKGE